MLHAGNSNVYIRKWLGKPCNGMSIVLSRMKNVHVARPINRDLRENNKTWNNKFAKKDTVAFPLHVRFLRWAGQIEYDQLSIVRFVHYNLVQFHSRVHPSDVALVPVACVVVPRSKQKTRTVPVSIFCVQRVFDAPRYAAQPSLTVWRQTSRRPPPSLHRRRPSYPWRARRTHCWPAFRHRPLPCRYRWLLWCPCPFRIQSGRRA